MKDSLLHETDIIQSISFDQHEIIADIVRLHCPWGIDVDPTYCRGGFYLRIPRPEYCYDINPIRPVVLRADCRDLPIEAESVRSVMFDPPFLWGGGNSAHMKKKYGGFDTKQELLSLYEDSLREFARVLKPDGILIFKCQDYTRHKNHFIHVWVMNAAETRGFQAIDLFIKLNKSALVPWNMKRQHYARKMHTYFWVFKRTRE